MDYIYQNVEVFTRWMLVVGAMAVAAVVGEPLAHIAVKFIKRWFDARS